MDKKDQLIKYITILEKEAIKEKKNQGLILFHKTLEEIKKPNSNIKEIIEKTKKSLSGILAHGSINDKEFETIQKVFKL
jgi:NurA-like 5'-3' nuclease